MFILCPLYLEPTCCTGRPQLFFFIKKKKQQSPAFDNVLMAPHPIQGHNWTAKDLVPDADISTFNFITLCSMVVAQSTGQWAPRGVVATLTGAFAAPSDLTLFALCQPCT